MIISHKYKFIFIKTMKTAGTSIEIALSRFCGPRDIITPIDAADEMIRRQTGGRGPQRYQWPLHRLRPADWRHWWQTGERRKRFYNHISATEVKAALRAEAWRDYFKFTVERNPWDRVISYYYWCHQSEPRPTLAEFIQSDKPCDLMRWGYHLYAIDGQPVVDKVCRYETLEEELEAVRGRLGLPEPLRLPRAKSGTRGDARPYRAVLQESERDRIAAIFQKPIELMGYAY